MAKKVKQQKQELKTFHLFKGMLRLVASDFEKRFNLFNNEYQIFTELGWSDASKKHGLLIDLSQIRWVELGAAAQLVLLIESAKKQALKITIALPLVKLSKGESESLEKSKNVSDADFQKKSDLSFQDLLDFAEKNIDKDFYDVEKIGKVLEFRSAVGTEDEEEMLAAVQIDHEILLFALSDVSQFVT